MGISRVFVPVLLIVGLTGGFLTAEIEAKPLSKPVEKKFAIKHSRLVLVPKITGGILVGDAADTIKLYDDNFSARFLHGGAFSVEAFLSRRFAASINFEMAFKDIPGSSLKPIKGFSTSFGGLFKVVPNRKGSLYFRGEIGSIKMTLPDYYSPSVGLSSDLEIGSFGYYRIGVGIINYTGSRSTVSSECYFKTISTDGERVSGIGSITINTSYVGLEIAWGIGLFGFN